MEKPAAGKLLLDDTVSLTAVIEASQNLQSHTVRVIHKADKNFLLEPNMKTLHTATTTKLQWKRNSINTQIRIELLRTK